MADKPGVPMTPPSGGGGSQGTPANPVNKGNPPVDRPWEPDKPGGPPVDPPDTPIGKGPDFPFKPGNPPPGNPGPTPPGQVPRNPPVSPPETPPTPNDPPPSENPGDPGAPLEPSQYPGTGGNFSKGQVRNEPINSTSGATRNEPIIGAKGNPEQFYGSNRTGFDPYFGQNQGAQTGGGATSYDPLGIGNDAYTNPNADVWSMTGVNSVLAPGAKVKPRYGVVGGNGGYGYGMVGQDYSGPLANDPRELVRGLRQQRRQMNRLGTARPGGPGGHVGGPGTPSGPGGWTKPGVSSSGDDMNNWKGQPAGGSGGGATGGGAGTTTGGQGGKWGAPPPAAGANTGGASPEPAMLGGGTGGAGGGGFDPGGGGGNMGPDQSALARNLPLYSASSYDTPFGRLVTSSTGNNNVFQKNGGSGEDLYHYDPTQGWKHMTAQEYKGYGDYNYADPTKYAKQAGALNVNPFAAAGGPWKGPSGGLKPNTSGVGSYA